MNAAEGEPPARRAVKSKPDEGGIEENFSFETESLGEKDLSFGALRSELDASLPYSTPGTTVSIMKISDRPWVLLKHFAGA